MKKTIIITLLIASTFSVQSQNWWNSSKKIKGNGNVLTKTRSVASFEAISIGGSFDVNLIDDTEGKITIEGEENIIPYIITEVENGTLKVKFKKNLNIRTTEKLVVTIGFNTINSIAIGGSGNVNVLKKIITEKMSLSLGGSGNIKAAIKATAIKTSIGGSGNIQLAGSTQNLKCSIAGSGNIKAYNLKTKEVKASIAGSGNIKITVSDKIKASVVGSGSIYYKGSPEFIDTKSVGSGDVINKN